MQRAAYAFARNARFLPTDDTSTEIAINARPLRQCLACNADWKSRNRRATIPATARRERPTKLGDLSSVTWHGHFFRIIKGIALNQSVEHVLMTIVDLFEQFSVDYAVMGGIAVRVHGVPRPTYDVDFTVAINEGHQLSAFFDEAETLGFEVPSIYRTGWRDAVGSMPLLKLKTYLAAGKSVDVDIFLVKTEFQKSVLSRRLSVDFEGRNLWFVTPEDLVLLKLIANRPRDLGDVIDVIFVQGELDEQYMHYWASKLGIEDRLTSVLNQ